MATHTYTVDTFISDHGPDPVNKYVHSLPKDEKGAILAAFLDIAQNGWSGLTDVRPIAPKLWEIKVSQHRVFYTAYGTEVVLLHAYKKQSDKAPMTEINTAKSRLSTENKRRGG